MTTEETQIEYPLFGLRTNQLAVFHNPARFRVVVACCCFGKTQLSLLEMLRAAERPNSLSGMSVRILNKPSAFSGSV